MNERLCSLRIEELLLLADTIALALPSSGIDCPNRVAKRNKLALICWFRDNERRFTPVADAVFSAVVSVADVFFNVSRYDTVAYGAFVAAVRAAAGAALVASDVFPEFIASAAFDALVAAPEFVAFVASARPAAPARPARPAAPARFAVLVPAPAAPAQEDDLFRWDEFDEFM
jgi:hypothetical protein